MNKEYLTFDDVKGLTSEIIRQMALISYRPSIVVGISRGGLLPATLLSQYFRVPLIPLSYSNRDHVFCEDLDMFNSRISIYDKVLIVDDINDSGKTFNSLNGTRWITKEYLTAALFEKPSSSWVCDFVGKEIKSNSWIVFPLEDWWK